MKRRRQGTGIPSLLRVKYAGPLEVYLLAANAHPGALKTHPGALEAHSRVMEAHPGAV